MLVILLVFLLSWKIECTNETGISTDFPKNFSSPSLENYKAHDSRNACVFLSANKNWRTASFLELNILHFRGNSSVNYLINYNRELKKVCAKNENAVANYNIEVVSTKETNSDLNSSIKAALSFRPVKRIVTGDEGCDCKYSHCGLFPNKRNIIAREYFSETFMPKWEFSFGRSKSMESIVYIPLGPRFDYGLSHWDESDNTTSKRKWLFNLIISPTTESRKKLFSSVKSQSFAKQLGLSLPFVANMAHSWHGTFSSNRSDSINTTTYKYILQNSVFTLCPTGHNPESFRIYEAAEAGSIPILAVDKDYENHGCKNAYLPLIKYQAPFVFIKDWKLLPKTLASFAAAPEKIAALQRRLRPWYQEFLFNISQQLDMITVNAQRGIKRVSAKRLTSV